MRTTTSRSEIDTEAIRQMRHDEGRKNVLYLHLTLVPFIRAAGEIKTKPTQQSVGRLREIGIQTDVIVCRSERAIGEEARAKISLFCNVEDRAVIEEKDVETSIYEIPEVLRRGHGGPRPPKPALRRSQNASGTVPLTYCQT